MSAAVKTDVRIITAHHELTDAVNWVAKSLPARPPLPTLGGVVLQADHNTLTVSGFDYDTSTRATITASTTGDSRLLVSARLLAAITKALPAKGDVTLTVADQLLTVAAGPAQFTLPLMPIQDYPPLPAAPQAIGTLDPVRFSEAVTRTAIAAGDDKTIPMLTGVHLEFDGTQLTLAGTDRFRLAVAEMVWAPGTGGPPSSMLVPAVQLVTAASTFTADSGPVTMGVTGGTLGFSTDDRQVTLRLLDHEFVRYKNLLPTAHTTTVDVPAASMTAAIKRAAIVTDRGSHVHLIIGDGTIGFTGGDTMNGIGASTENVPADIDGPGLHIAFAPGYLLDAITATGGGTVRMQFTKPARPALFSCPGDTGYRHLVMPARMPG